MTTKLTQALRRQVLVDKQPYTLVVSPDGLKLAEKGHRKGFELKWKDLVSGDAALAAALSASVAAHPVPAREKSPGTGKRRRRR